MRVSRLTTLVSCLLVFSSAPALAQEATPTRSKADVKTSEGASRKAPKAKRKPSVPSGPFLAKPYLQLGHVQARGSSFFSGTPRMSTPRGLPSTNQEPSRHGSPSKPLRSAESQWQALSRTVSTAWH